MNSIEHPSGIMLFENVLAADMCFMLINKFQKDPNKVVEKPAVDEENNIGNYRTCSTIFLNTRDDWSIERAILNEALRKCFTEYATRFQCGAAGVLDKGHEFVCYKAGDVCGEHRDGGPYQLRVFASCIMFLNTIYDGGELCFPLQKTEIKPTVGSVLLFPATFAHPHLTKPAKTDRYVIVNFLAHKDFKP